MLEGIHHISIPMDDLEEGRDFYAGLLELVEVDMPTFPEEGYWFHAGSCQLHLSPRAADQEGGPVPGTGSGEVHFAFSVSRIDAVRDRLAGAGVEVQDRVDPGSGARQIFFRDPSNNLVEIFLAS